MADDGKRAPRGPPHLFSFAARTKCSYARFPILCHCGPTDNRLSCSQIWRITASSTRTKSRKSKTSTSRISTTTPKVHAGLLVPVPRLLQNPSLVVFTSHHHDDDELGDACPHLLPTHLSCPPHHTFWDRLIPPSTALRCAACFSLLHSAPLYPSVPQAWWSRTWRERCAASLRL